MMDIIGQRGIQPINTRPFSPEILFCSYFNLKQGVQTIEIPGTKSEKKLNMYLYIFDKMNWKEQIIPLEIS